MRSIALAIVTTMAFATMAAQTAMPQGAITGVAVDGASGAALSDVVVGVVAQPGTQLPPGYQARQMTDGKGRFAFLNLPNDGTFQLTAGKYGYLDGGYGRDSGPGDSLRTITIANGAWAGNLRVPIWRPAVISGAVRDENGEPTVGTFVRALGRIRLAGRDELAAGPVAITDDYGRYRIAGLLPGRYLIQVPSVQTSVPAGTRIGAPTTDAPEGAVDVDDTARLVIGRYPLPPPSVNGRAMAYPSAFHPNVSTPAEAVIVEVRFGDDRAGVDVTLTPRTAVRVSGIVDAPPEALTNLTVRLLPAGMENLGLGAEVASASVSANGEFTFLNVPAGTYLLDAPITFKEFSVRSGPTTSGGTVGSGAGPSLPPPPGSAGWSRGTQGIDAIPGVGLSATDFRGVSGAKIPPYSGRMSVAVGGSDVANIVLRLRAGTVLRGKLIVEPDPAKPAPPQPPRFSLLMDPATGQPSLGQPSTQIPTGNNQDFEISGIEDGSYFLRVQSGGAPWLVKSIQWRGRDYTTMPFEGAADDLGGVVVTVTNAVPTLTGTARDRNGALSEAGMVIVFPAEPAQRTNTGLWPSRLRSTTLSSTGAFQLTTLPAGEYFVAAIDRSRAATWRDPEFLAAIERQATRVTLVWGQTTTRDLTMAVLR